MLHPITSGTTADVEVLWQYNKMVTNTNNAFGTTDASNNISLVKSTAPGPLGRDLIPLATAPKFSTNKVAFISTGALQQSTVNTDLEFTHYKATPADLKWIYMCGGLNMTDSNYIVGIIGNNGWSNGNNGFSIFNDAQGADNYLNLFISGNGGEAIGASFNGILPFATEHVLTIRVDNALGSTNGKVKAYINQTLHSANSGGSGLLANSPAPNFRVQSGDLGTSGTSNSMTGSKKVELLISGSLTDGEMTKLQSDMAAYLA
jgi:hypothetical protein